MSTSFGWKRKSGAGVVRKASEAFEGEAKDEELDNEVTRGEVDWLTLAPKKRLICLEDAKAKSRRLREEGATLAEAERHWEAIKKWDEALLVLPDDSRMLEMKAQALMVVGEVFPAVQTAQQAVNADPTWWEARQTLGRAQLNMGEVKLAVRSFCKAVMLNPADQALWEDDLLWARSVKDRMKNSECSSNSEVQHKSSSVRVEDISGGVSDGEQCDSEGPLTSVGDRAVVVKGSVEERDCSDSKQTVLKVPANYVHLRG